MRGIEASWRTRFIALLVASFTTLTALSITTEPAASAASAKLWPFATKVAGTSTSGQYRRIDQGWDLQAGASAKIIAIASGTLHEANSNPGGFGDDYPYETLDTPIAGSSGRTYSIVYYGHVHASSAFISPSRLGQHVSAGDTIAVTNSINCTTTNYTSKTCNGSLAPPGWVEVGFDKVPSGPYDCGTCHTTTRPTDPACQNTPDPAERTLAGVDMCDDLVNATTATQYYFLRDVQTGRCLHEVSTTNNVNTNPCDTTSGYQQWQQIPDGSTLLFKNRQTGRCLHEVSTTNNVNTNPCDTTSGFQHWSTTADHSAFLVKNRQTGRCLHEVASPTDYVNTNPCNTSSSYQHWVFSTS